MSTDGSQVVLRGYWLAELHREVGKRGVGLRSSLVRDATGNATRLDIAGTGDTTSISVRATPAPGGGWDYTDGHGNRIASVDDCAIALWEIRARIKR